MKVLVDTSVWVDFLNGHPSEQQAVLADLIQGTDELCTCGVVVAEVFQGLQQQRGRKGLENLFRKLVFLEATGIGIHLRAAGLYRSLRSKGITVRSTIDCLIAVLAEENGCTILARDRDITSILASGLVRSDPVRHSPPPSGTGSR
ncbi:MAG TPA: PIN domain-containing protein [Acidobacteriota bacterium]